MARNEGTKLGVALVEAIGVDPNNCLSLSLSLNWNADDYVTLDVKVIASDAEEKIVIKDDAPVVELRTWTEGRFKRYMPIFGDARDDALPTLYERIDGDE